MKIINGIIRDNPIFVLMLGLCSSLAVTTKLENAYLMGICVFIVLLFSNITISLIKKFVSDNIRIPVYIIIIGTFVTILEILLENYIPKLYEVLGIYLPLIVVNCIILGRALSVASKNNVKDSIKDAVGTSLGYTLALIFIALFREIFGNNTITIIDSLSTLLGRSVIINLGNNDITKLSFLKTPGGAFFTLAILMVLFNYLRNRGSKNESN